MSTQTMIKITADNFSAEVETATRPVLVDFSAPWCGYCRRLAPVIGQLSAEFSDKLSFGEINIDDDPSLAERFSVDTIPTLYLFQGGRATGPLVNPGSKAQIVAWLRENGAI